MTNMHTCPQGWLCVGYIPGGVVVKALSTPATTPCACVHCNAHTDEPNPGDWECVALVVMIVMHHT